MTAAQKAIAKGARNTEILGIEIINGQQYEISRQNLQDSASFTLFAENLDSPTAHIWTLDSWECEAQSDEDGEYAPAIPCTVETLRKQIEWKSQNPDGLSRMGVAVRVPYPGC